jgi:hypothetical protein
MHNTRALILDGLAEGGISFDEAERLLLAVASCGRKCGRVSRVGTADHRNSVFQLPSLPTCFQDSTPDLWI